MTRRIECVPNFSEGRRPEIIEPIVATVRDVPGVKLLDAASDADHNRTVVTLVGEPKALCAALLDFVREAKERIDLRNHTGQHPRMGAVDVIPFVPLENISMDECVHISRRFAKTLYETLGIPSFLYEQSATAPHRKNLADLRKGGFEGMAEKIRRPDFRPDFGTELHESFGIVAIGARPFLVAFNVNLDSDDLALARRIAHTVREKDGGLPAVKAMGVALDAGTVQVSMNLTDTARTSVFQAWLAVKTEAEKAGVSVARSEIIGLIPPEAVADSFSQALQLEGFSLSQVLSAEG